MRRFRPSARVQTEKGVIANATAKLILSIAGRGSARRGFSLLAGSTLLGQLIAFLWTIAVARIYGPADLGDFALILAVSAGLIPLATLRLDLAIASSSSDRDVLGLVRLGFRWMLTLVGVVSLVLFLLGFALGVTGTVTNWALWCFVPILVLVNGSFVLLVQVALRQRQYRSVAVRGVVQSTLVGGIQCLMAIPGPSALGLAVGESIGRAFGFASLLPTYQRLRTDCTHTSRPALSELWARYGGAVRHATPGSFLEYVAAATPVVLATIWFGSSTAGEVGLTYRLLAVPVALIGSGLARVIVAETTHAMRRSEADPLKVLTRSIKPLLMTALVFALVVFTLSPYLFQTVLGNEWAQAGELARWMAIPAAVGLVWSPLTGIMDIYRRWGSFLLLALARLVFSLTTAWLLHSAGAPAVAVFSGMAGTVAAVQIIGLIILYRIVRNEPLPDFSTESGPDSSATGSGPPFA